MRIKRKEFFTRIIVAFLAISVLTTFVPTGISAAGKVDAQAYNLSAYNSEDIAAINNMIENNGLEGYLQNDPANWNFVSWTSVSGVYRINRFQLPTNVLSGDLVLSGVGLERLDALDISFQNDLNSVTIKDMEKLPYLRVKACNNVKEVTIKNLPLLFGATLESLPEMNQLDISNLPIIKNLGIYSCPKLGSLNLNGREEEGMPILDDLKVNGCNLKTVEMTDFLVLDELFLSDNKISDLKLTNLPKLRGLYLRNNELTDIDTRHLPKLTSVDIRSNRVYDVSKAPDSLLSTSGTEQNVTRTFHTNDVTVGISSFRIPEGTTIIRGRRSATNNVKDGNPAYNSSQPDTINADFIPNGDMLTTNIGKLESLDGTVKTDTYVINLIAFAGVTGDNITLPAATSENINCSLTSELLPGYTPTFAFEQVSGEEYFTVDNSGMVTGIKQGEGKVKIIASTKEDTSLRSETIVDVTITKGETPDSKPEEGGSETIVAEDNGSKAVVTGDESQMTQWIVAGGFAFALMTLSFITKKKKEQ